MKSLEGKNVKRGKWTWNMNGHNEGLRGENEKEDTERRRQ